jgi:hypothetical protein
MAKIYISSVINAPRKKVWEKIRDFNALPDWHPFIAKSRIEDGLPGATVGAVRNFDLKDGANIREKLLSLSDNKHLCTYSILEAPLPVKNYVATLRLNEITDGDKTFAEWSANFNVTEDNKEEETIKLVTSVFQSGFDSLKKIFG